MHRFPSPRTALTAFAAASALALAGCGAQNSADGQGKVKVAASTNVYGSIAQAIGGDKVSVTTVIPAVQDPHSYEASAKDKLTVKDADVVLVNGGGYDSFMSKFAAEEGKSADLVDAVASSGLPGAEEAGHADAAGHDHSHDHGEFNEHVWYSMKAMAATADKLAAELAEHDGANKAYYEENAKAFRAELGKISAQAAAVKKSAPGASTIMTEPVPGYLLAEAGVKDATDAKLTAAVESESDIPAAVLDSTTKQISAGKISFLSLNTQTSSPQVQKLADAADTAKMPVVRFSETVPEGKSYAEWMKSNIDSIQKAAAK